MSINIKKLITPHTLLNLLGVFGFGSSGYFYWQGFMENSNTGEIFSLENLGLLSSRSNNKILIQKKRGSGPDDLNSIIHIFQFHSIIMILQKLTVCKYFYKCT